MAQGFEQLISITTKMASPDVMRETILNLFGEYHPRIFEKGIASDGTGIGEYSTKPIYINPAISPKKFEPEGKGWETINKGKVKKVKGLTQRKGTGIAHTTKYFEGGYKQFKSDIGRESAFVNLQLTENLKRATVPDVQVGKYVFGFTNEKEKLKAEGNEERFEHKIFDLTQAEINRLPILYNLALKKRGL